MGYDNLFQAFAAAEEQIAARAKTDPTLANALEKYEKNIKYLEEELEYKLKCAKNGNINWDEDAIEETHKLKVDNYKKKVKNYLNDYLSYITDYLSVEEKRKINKRCKHKMFNV